jgi:hypothetical protein
LQLQWGIKYIKKVSSKYNQEEIIFFSYSKETKDMDITFCIFRHFIKQGTLPLPSPLDISTSMDHRDIPLPPAHNLFS